MKRKKIGSFKGGFTGGDIRDKIYISPPGTINRMEQRLIINNAIGAPGQPGSNGIPNMGEIALVSDINEGLNANLTRYWSNPVLVLPVHTPFPYIAGPINVIHTVAYGMAWTITDTSAAQDGSQINLSIATVAMPGIPLRNVTLHEA